MDIFNTFKNLQLTNLNQYELYSILSSISQYKIKSRDELCIEEQITYSPEIEFICRSYDRAKRLFPKDKFNNWTLKEEFTIGNGFEITPSSFLKNTYKDYKEVHEILNIIKKDPLSYIDYRCGMHMNIGTQAFIDKNHLDRFILLWLAYEEVIFRFCYGDYMNPRKKIKNVAAPLRYNININNYKEPNNLLYTSKSNAISLCKATSFNYKYNNVLEIRCPNATLNFMMMQNELNLFCHMIDYTKKEFDEAKIKTIINKKENIQLESYNKIFLQESLEFADMLFDNSLDKCYFLKQYLKNNKEIPYDNKQEKMIKCKWI